VREQSVILFPPIQDDALDERARNKKETPI
jgi:hypothetical protein